MKPCVICLLLLLLFTRNEAQSICSGQGFILDHTNVSLMLSQLQNYFTNCEYIYGNLEIIFPRLTDIPGQFSDIFNPIREIQGYLLFENIRAETLNLSNLVIIRGESNFTLNNTLSALVLKNTEINTLLLTNLKEITNFGVNVYNEALNVSTACNLNGVDWTDITNGSNVYLSQNCPSQPCNACSPSYCWTENNCQMLTLINCTCNGGRCATNSSTECCSTTLCSAGCTTSITCNTCLGCRRFESGSDTCLVRSSCIPTANLRGYSFLTPPFLSESCAPPLVVNPMGNIGFCILQCPNANVDQCIEIQTNQLLCRDCQPSQNENECTPYPSSQITLPALNVPSIPKASCNITNINSIVLGNDSFAPTNPITPSYLNVFSKLTVITDYLVIRDFPSYYGDVFSFLSRLERIEGSTLYMGQYSLYVTGNSFRQLDLRNLGSIANGAVLIENNINLGYLPTFQGFSTLTTSGSQNIQVQSTSCPCHSLCESDMGCWGPSNVQCIECSVVEIDSACEANCESLPNTFSSNASKECQACDAVCNNCTGLATNCTECLNVSLVSGECLASCPGDTFQNGTDCIPCSSNCRAVDGSRCSGPTNNFGSNGCTECNLYLPQTNASSNFTCVSECVNSYEDTTPTPGPVCLPCDPACTSCTGPSVAECDLQACSEFLQDSQRCVLTCSNDTHYISAARTCTRCDENCIGCNGTSNTDCINCRTFKRENACVSNCPTTEFVNSNSECEPCDTLCSSCTGTRDNCTSCALAEFIQNGTRTCLSECPPGYYRAANLTCLTCNPECFNCTGALATDCVGRCRNFQLLPDDECVRVCPETSQINNITMTCTILSTSLSAGAIAGISIAGVIIILMVISVVITIIVVGKYSRKYKKEKEKVEQGTLLPLREHGNIQRTIEGMPELTLLGFNYESLAEATPAVFPLHIINKDALDFKELLGKGFYGSVYAAQYNQNSGDGFPVAVKSLNEKGLKNDFADTITKAMQDISTLTHPSLVQVFGYNPSMNSPFIVTQLLIGPTLYDLFARYPGCIDENKIFRYIVQVGDGMAYLEKQGLVYGLVASRNVILENQDKIKLTDFFIYRFSDPIPDNEADLPIQERWMSPEFALNHNPNNKSDVWSFGVLFWELLSYVKLPYDSVPDDNVVSVLQQGQRLPQPIACSVDLYGYLLQCFLFEPSGRPTFEKLQNELVDMSKYPQKYISLQQVNLQGTKTNKYQNIKLNDRANLVIGNANTLTQNDISIDELGIGEYIDEEQVNRNIDSETISRTAQAKTIEELGLGEYVDEEQVNKLIDADSIEPLIKDDVEYGEVSQASGFGESAANEYAEVDANPKEQSGSVANKINELQLPNFVSLHNPVSTAIPDHPVDSIDLIPSPYEEATAFVSPSNSFFSPYETMANEKAKT